MVLFAVHGRLSRLSACAFGAGFARPRMRASACAPFVSLVRGVAGMPASARNTKAVGLYLQGNMTAAAAIKKAGATCSVRNVRGRAQLVRMPAPTCPIACLHTFHTVSHGFGVRGSNSQFQHL